MNASITSSPVTTNRAAENEPSLVRTSSTHGPKTPLRLRFKRAIKFPRFSMAAGEVWDCHQEWGDGRAYLEAVSSGEDRFPFAGGQCLLQDVEVQP